MKILCKIKFEILISTETLFHKKNSYKVPVRIKNQKSKIRKTVMKQKFKR